MTNVGLGGAPNLVVLGGLHTRTPSRIDLALILINRFQLSFENTILSAFRRRKSMTESGGACEAAEQSGVNESATNLAFRSKSCCSLRA